MLQSTGARARHLAVSHVLSSRRPPAAVYSLDDSYLLSRPSDPDNPRALLINRTPPAEETRARVCVGI